MKAIIITLIFILMSSLNSNAQNGKYTYTFHGSNTAYRKVTPYTGTVDYTFKNGEVTKISLHPSWNAADCKNVVVEVPEEKIKEYEKNIDSFFSYIPEYEGGFIHNDKWYWTKGNIRFFHSFYVSEMGVQLVIMKTDMKAYTLKDSHGLWDDLKMMSGAGTEPASLRVCYFTFNSEEDLQSFIDAVDVEKIKADLKAKKKQNRNLDRLFQ